MKIQGGAAMLRAITHFDQVPLSVVIDIMERQIHARAAALSAESAIENRQPTYVAKAVTTERGFTMNVHTPIDIFRVEPKGVLWLESSTSVDEARARIQMLGLQNPGEYVVLNQTTGNKLMIKADGMNTASGC
jgi:hypothetical protein